MTQEQLKQLERELWDAADELRGNSKLTAAEYKDPILGLVLLRFAQNRYEDAKTKINKQLPINPRTQQTREATKDDYAAAGAILLPAKAKYEYLASLPEDADIAQAINNAMGLIEGEYPDLAGILPKNYQEFGDKLLRELIRLFNKDAVKKAKGDVFGRIYEFFLMKFSMQGAGAQEGGEFFTPPSLVKLIVNFIQPNLGIIHDPACGSGGMFVQTAHFIENHENKKVNEAIRVYGTELKSNNAKLAKMNLAIHGIEGKVIEGNSFYADPHNLYGQCDYVMANPPFNVDKVDAKNKFLAEDRRLPWGPPTTGKGTIGNGNYLWIQYFLSYLNPTGRAGFVMASSATDAGNAEKGVRQQLIQTGHVDCIVSIGNNFFYTRSLPCHVWFFDKGKRPENKKRILMIDARNTFRVVNSTVNDFSPGQQINLTAIAELYRNNPLAMNKAETEYNILFEQQICAIFTYYAKAHQELNTLIAKEKFKDLTLPPMMAMPSDLNLQTAETTCRSLQMAFDAVAASLKQAEADRDREEAAAKKKNLKKTEISKLLQPFKNRISKLGKVLKKYSAETNSLFAELTGTIKNCHELHELFPDGQYRDIEGLCKIVDLKEVEEQDYSLTPGRYVGVSIDIDMDFDYKSRMQEIHTELAQLNNEANELMGKIQEVKFG